MSSSTSTQFTIGEQVGSLALVIILSSVAGMLVGLLGGYEFPKIWKFKGYKLKPLITKITIPPLLGMIIMGCVTRNAFGSVMKPYPTVWAGWMRNCCLAVVLVRGGLSVTFKGKGLIVLMLSFIPQLFEATTGALVGLGLFDMPIEVCFALGYAFAAVSSAIVIPTMMNFDLKGYGKKRGIPGSIIAACTFDDIIGIICFGICKNIVFQRASERLGNSNSNMPLTIGMLFIQNIAGLGVGVIVGLLAWPFKFIRNYKYCIQLKGAFCFACAIAFILAGEFSTFTDSKYIASLSLGYTCFQFWGDHKPTKQLASVWWYIQVFLFGTVGAQLLISQLRPSDIGFSIITLIVAMIARMLSVILITFGQNFSFKERIFMSTTWLTKSTVPATLAGVLLLEAKNKGPGYEDIQKYGLLIQTSAILSIILWAPIGTFLMNALGPKCLSLDQIEPIDKSTPEKDVKTIAEEEERNSPRTNEREHEAEEDQEGGGLITKKDSSDTPVDVNPINEESRTFTANEHIKIQPIKSQMDNKLDD